MADVQVTFSASIEQLTQSMNEVRFALEGLTNPIRAVRDSMGELAEAFAAAFAVEKIASFMERMAELGTQTQRTAALLGVSTDQVGGLDIAAKASGGSLEGMSTALERFGLNLARGESGSKQQEAALRALGLSARDFVGVPLPDALAKLADHFAVIKDGVDKDAIAISLLGRSGADMIPIFNQGGNAFKEFSAIAERAGTNISPQLAKALEDTHLKILEMDASFRGAGLSISTVFKPAFDGLVKVTTDLVEAFTKSVKEGGAMAYVLVGMTAAVQAVATALAVSISTVEELWEITKAAVFSMGEWFKSLGRIMKDAFTFNWSDIGAAWGDLQAQMAARAAITGKSMVDIWKKTTDEIETIWGAGDNAHNKINQNQRRRLDIANADAISAAMKAIDQQVKTLEDGLKRQTMLVDEDAKNYRISQSQKFTAIEEYTQRTYEAELQLLQKESALGGLSVAQHQAVLNKIEQLQEKHKTDMIKLDQQQYDAERQEIAGYVNNVQSSWNSSLRGMLAGTTSFGQAMKSIIADLIIYWIEQIEKKYVFEQLTTALTDALHIKSAAVEEATAASSTAASLPVRAAKFSSDIMADAASVFGGIFANLAPLLGPAAAGPAAAGQATVLAELANIPKFDLGTNFVTASGLAIIHRGEAIVPAQSNGPYSAASAGGSMIFAPNLSAFNPQGLQALINQMMPQFARAFVAYQGRTPSLGMA